MWWGVRAILDKTPNATLDERFLSIQLNVQEVAAKQYIAELNSVGILTEENKATPLALKWRLDESYKAAADQLISAVYPESLRHVAPSSEGDRQKAVSWFLQEGLGLGAAGNKAATYFLLGSKEPNEAPGRSATGRASNDDKSLLTSTRGAKTVQKTKEAMAQKGAKPRDKGDRHANGSGDNFPLNVNMQIHISADAGSEQIEAIFSAMRR